MDKTADAVVIGGGIMGAATAHFLAKQQFGKVVLLEKSKLAAVSTGHSAAIVRTFYSNPLTLRLALRAREMFENAEQELGGDCEFRRTGYCCIFAEKAAATGEQLLAIERPAGGAGGAGHARPGAGAGAAAQRRRRAVRDLRAAFRIRQSGQDHGESGGPREGLGPAGL